MKTKSVRCRKRVKLSEGGWADIKEAFVRASQIAVWGSEPRSSGPWGPWEWELNAYGAELYLQGFLPSTFSFFIINYFWLIARIRKRGKEKGCVGSQESWSSVCTVCAYAVCLHIHLCPSIWRKEQEEGAQMKDSWSAVLLALSSWLCLLNHRTISIKLKRWS